MKKKAARKLAARRRQEQDWNRLHGMAHARIKLLPEPLQERVWLESPARGVVRVSLRHPGSPPWLGPDPATPKFDCKASQFPTPELIGRLLVLA